MRKLRTFRPWSLPIKNNFIICHELRSAEILAIARWALRWQGNVHLDNLQPDDFEKVRRTMQKQQPAIPMLLFFALTLLLPTFGFAQTSAHLQPSEVQISQQLPPAPMPQPTPAQDPPSQSTTIPRPTGHRMCRRSRLTRPTPGWSRQ